MSRLVAFGCSLTYGHGLPDCHISPNKPGPTPSKFAWPNVIATELGIECINLSVPGSSNKSIWHKIVNFKFHKGDIVFVLWSYPERYSILFDKTKERNIGPWMEDTEVASYYQNLYNEYDSLQMTKLFINHANMFLGAQGIKIFNLIVKKQTKKILELGGSVVPHVPVYCNDFYRHSFPKALDNSHPGVECHLQIAKDILTYLNVSTSIPEQRTTTLFGKINSIFKRTLSSNLTLEYKK